ncbi:MAG TPA: YeeE/YedE family protein [Chloroflexota bacterium]|nr:YeeE/YedE family protein [Chloroflexota bacterium]
MSVNAPAAAQRAAFGVPFPLAGLLKVAAVLAALGLLVMMSVASPTYGVFWAFGLAFGVILQRSRLCFASAFRDLFLLGDGRTMRAILVALGLATLGFALIMTKAVPDPSAGALPDQAHVIPIGWYLVVGGVTFGLGMVIAGGCVSGTLYRIGEGYVASIFSLVGILVGLEVAAHTWNWWYHTEIATAPVFWLPNIFGYVGAIAVTIALLTVAYLLTLWREAGRGPQIPLRKKAEVEPATVKGKVASSYRQWFVAGWPITTGALALAILNIFAYTYDHPLGVTGELGTWAERGFSAFGLGAGTLDGAATLAGCNLVAGNGASWLTGNFALDAGLVFGAFVAAVLASEFKLRFPRQKVRYAQSLAGGSLMGYGAGIAAGCTIGAFFSAVPSLGLNGWVFGLSLLAGAAGGVQVIKRIA